MSILVIILLALGLALDAFAVSICCGAASGRIHLCHALRMAGFFGFFQAAMPIAGWSLGRFAAGPIRTYDHWIAFGLLGFIGGKMIFEALVFEKDCRECGNSFSLPVLFTLAIATSIDAAAVGISLSLLSVDIIRPAIIIGTITFCISFGGVLAGRRLGSCFGGKVEIAGGIVLIGIGCKILVEHLFF